MMGKFAVVFLMLRIPQFLFVLNSFHFYDFILWAEICGTVTEFESFIFEVELLNLNKHAEKLNLFPLREGKKHQGVLTTGFVLIHCEIQYTVLLFT